MTTSLEKRHQRLAPAATVEVQQRAKRMIHHATGNDQIQDDTDQADNQENDRFDPSRRLSKRGQIIARHQHRTRRRLPAHHVRNKNDNQDDDDVEFVNDVVEFDDDDVEFVRDEQKKENGTVSSRSRSRTLNVFSCGRTNTFRKLLSPLVAAALVCVWSALVVPSLASPFETCVSQMRASDTNGDANLSETEFESAMNILTNGADSTGAAVLAAYTNASSTSVSDPTALESLCQAAYQGVLTDLGITVTATFCDICLSRGDSNNDNFLETTEYPVFLNILTGSKVSSSTPYASLPTGLITVFSEYAVGGEVNITGSKAGTTMSVSVAQRFFIYDFCIEAAVVGATESSSPTSTTTTTTSAPAPAPASSTTATPAPVASSTTTTTAAPTTISNQQNWNTAAYSLTVCNIDMFLSDSNKNDYIDESEYVTWCNRISKLSYTSFATLPTALQTNYITLSDGNTTLGINITGSGPGYATTATPMEMAQMNRICGATYNAVQGVLTGTTVPTPAPRATTTTSAPTAAGGGTGTNNNSSAGIPYSTCLQYLALSDGDHNNYLTQAEYFRFVNLAGNRTWVAGSFSTLPTVLQNNYNTLANGNPNGTDIYGATPSETPNADQTAHLQTLCLQTGIAIAQALASTSAPGGTTTLAPTPAATVVGQGNIYNAYIISNTQGLTASVLASGPNRQALDSGYAAFVAAQVAIFQGGNGTNATVRALVRQGSRRHLQTALNNNVTLITSSPLNYLLVDEPCPTGVTGTCQKVYASFAVIVGNSADHTAVVTALTNQTQAALAASSGGLQQYILAANATAPILVAAAASPPLRPPSSSSPALAPSSSSPGPQAPPPPASSGGKSSAGTIAGAVIGVLLGAGAVFGVYFLLKRRGIDCSGLSGMFTRGDGAKKKKDKNGSNKTDDDDDFGGGGGGANAVARPSGNGFGFEVEDPDANGDGFKKKNNFDDDDEDSAADEDSAPEEEENNAGAGSNMFNAFGRGKNKKGGGGFGDNSVGGLGGEEAFRETPSANDFADYAFDDPAADPEFKKKKNDESIGDLFSTQSSNASGSGKGWGEETSPQNGEAAAWGATGAGGAWGETKKSPSAASGSSRSRSEGEEERSGSYDDEESGSEEDSYYDEDEEESRFTRETFGNNPAPGTVPENVRQMDAMVDQGNWDGVIAATAKFDSAGFDDEASDPSKPSLAESEGLSRSEGSRSGSGSRSRTSGADEDASRGEGTENDTMQDSVSYTSEDIRRRNEYRGQIEQLVRKVVPDEIDNVSAMMDQFAGREAELINTLQAMEERTSVQRARKAVHKSKGIPQRDNFGFAAGGTDGSAAIAAASTLGVSQSQAPPSFDAPPARGGAFEEEEDDGQSFDEDEAEEEGEEYFDEEEEDQASGSYQSGSRSGSRSQYSGEEEEGFEEGGSQEGSRDPEGEYSGSEDRSGTGSYGDEGDQRSQASGSYNDEERSHSGAYDEGQEVGYGDDRSGSYVSGEGSYRSGSQRSGSYVSGEGSYRSGSQRSGSYVSGEGSYRSGSQRSGSYVSGEGSYRSGSQRSGSYVSGEGSYRSGSQRSGSYVSGEGSYRSGSQRSGSYVSGEGSRYSGEEGHPEDAEGSYYSDEGSRSRSGGEEGSYYSNEGEEERSYYSDEQSGSRSRSQSGSYEDDGFG